MSRRSRNTKRKSTAEKALALATKTARVVNQREKKVVDTSSLNVAPTYNGAVVNLFGPIQGDSDAERVGDAVMIDSLDFRVISGPTSAVGAAVERNFLRFILFRDKSDGITTGNKILEYLGNERCIISPYNEDYRRNWTLIKDWIVIIEEAKQLSVQKVVKRIMKQATFVDNNTTVSEGQLRLFYCSDRALPAVAFDYQVRVHFSDL